MFPAAYKGSTSSSCIFQVQHIIKQPHRWGIDNVFTGGCKHRAKRARCRLWITNQLILLWCWIQSWKMTSRLQVVYSSWCILLTLPVNVWMCAASRTVNTAQLVLLLVLPPRDVCRMSSCWPINSTSLLGHATFKVQKVAVSFEKIHKTISTVSTICPRCFPWPTFFCRPFRAAGDPIIPSDSGGAAAAPHEAQWAELWQPEKHKEPLILFIIPRIVWRTRQNSAMSSLAVRTRFGPSHTEGRDHLDLPPPSTPPPPVLYPTTTRCWIGHTFLASNCVLQRSSAASLCSPSMLLWTTGIRILHWKILVMKYFGIKLLNLTVATLNQLNVVYAEKPPFFGRISDCTYQQMFYFEQFLKLVSIFLFLFSKEGNVNDYFLFLFGAGRNTIRGVRLD